LGKGLLNSVQCHLDQIKNPYWLLHDVNNNNNNRQWLLSRLTNGPTSDEKPGQKEYYHNPYKGHEDMEARVASTPLIVSSVISVINANTQERNKKSAEHRIPETQHHRGVEKAGDDKFPTVDWEAL